MISGSRADPERSTIPRGTSSMTSRCTSRPKSGTKTVPGCPSAHDAAQPQHVSSCLTQAVIAEPLQEHALLAQPLQAD